MSAFLQILPGYAPNPEFRAKSNSRDAGKDVPDVLWHVWEPGQYRPAMARLETGGEQIEVELER